LNKKIVRVGKAGFLSIVVFTFSFVGFYLLSLLLSGTFLFFGNWSLLFRLAIVCGVIQFVQYLYFINDWGNTKGNLISKEEESSLTPDEVRKLEAMPFEDRKNTEHDLLVDYYGGVTEYLLTSSHLYTLKCEKCGETK